MRITSGSVGHDGIFSSNCFDVCSGLPHSVAFDWLLSQRNILQSLAVGLHGGNS